MQHGQKKVGNQFDIIMGSFDGTKICQLVGMFILYKLEAFNPKQSIGLYRDDGLAVLNLPGPRLEQMKKALVNFSKKWEYRQLLR